MKNFKKTVSYSNWFITNWCSNCEARFSDHELYHTDGVCPYCGETGYYWMPPHTVKTTREKTTKIYKKVEILGFEMFIRIRKTKVFEFKGEE